MSAEEARAPARSGDAAALAAVALVLVGAWAIAAPYLASAVGLRVAVPSSVEVVDHVVPGAAAVLSGAALAAMRRRRGDHGAGTVALAAAGLSFLAGAWVTSTHVPLLVQASRGLVGWGAALLHTSSGPPIALVGLLLLVAVVRGPGGEDSR